MGVGLHAQAPTRAVRALWPETHPLPMASDSSLHFLLCEHYAVDLVVDIFVCSGYRTAGRIKLSMDASRLGL
jgi:hypothetical protein